MADIDLAKRRKLFLKQQLVRSFDVLLCAQLTVIYLHDVSTLRLVLGLVLQHGFLSTKFPLPPNFSKRHVIMLLTGYNLWCLAMHLLFAPPAAHRYIHGGMTIEFIGERPLRSRFPLVMWDLVAMGLQWSLFSLNYPPRHTEASEAGENTPESENAADEYTSLHGNTLVADIRITETVAENWRHGAEPETTSQDLHNPNSGESSGHEARGNSESNSNAERMV